MTQTAHLTRKAKAATYRDVDQIGDLAEDLAEDLQGETVTRLNAAVAATRSAGAAITADLAERAARTAELARELALERADAARAAVSEAGASLAGGLRAAAAAVPEGLPARSLAAMAGGVNAVATSLGGQSLSAMALRTRDFARRNPVTFVLGTAIVGFALVRLLKSGSKPVSPTP